ncbi:hypothetical protein QBC36DRAFT_308313 [Triangularia setosa]|uniref:RecQ mediated genome instability protein 1 N-terminal domain-containing protein n=1 Tax=Triangularia setosa TaxID=2587417 RepID=A0AAN7A8L6_9PEZI|nr:hypothetical protein QBC36DRAFT_308313 [Podospora setosa]
MAPEDSRPRNHCRFHPYPQHSYTDSPLKFLRRPADPNARLVSRVVSSGESPEQDSTPSSLADNGSTKGSTEPPSHQAGSTQTEEGSALRSSSNPIDLTSLVIHSQTSPKRTPVSQTVIRPQQRPRPILISQNPAQSRAPSHQNHSNQSVTPSPRRSQRITVDQKASHPQGPPHKNLTNDIQPRTPHKTPNNNNNNHHPQSQPASPEPNLAHQKPPMIPQKRPPISQNATLHPERPPQQRRLMPPPPPPAPSITRTTAMDLPQQIHTNLQSQTLPLPSLPWLGRLVSSRQPPLPLASLLATARARILAADLTTPDLLDQNYITSHSLPPALTKNPERTKSAVLPHDVVVQVMDIVNISKSKWEQVEEMEAKARGEEKRGREVVRVRDVDEVEGRGGVDQGTQAATQFQAGRERGGGATKAATHKLVFQDPKGEYVFGLELFRVEKLGVGQTNIGEKWLLKQGASVSRGVVMLEPEKCVYIGGKVEVWNKSWNEGRLARLRKEAMEGGSRQAAGNQQAEGNQD